MGLFGSIGKVFGGALKVAGKVAGVASMVAPIPGLGFAGKAASRLGGLLGKAKGIQARAGRILGPGTLTALSSTMPGGSQANQTFYASGYSGPKQLAGGAPGTKRRKGPKRYKTRRKKVGSMQTLYRGGRRIKRRRGRHYTAAQLRAGFGGRRRMHSR